MMKSTVDAGLPESEQIKSMVSSLWVVADCAGGFLGSSVGSIAFDMLGFRRGTLVITLAMGGTVIVIAGYCVQRRLAWRRRENRGTSDRGEQTQLLRGEGGREKYAAL
eukprot:TRINITY_DN25163_c0_g1_i1.p1 TRINITY_DN25163_c0_g1~~TRINITY_DN25163_c0_g1_i1.p1  ORF type:complete len:108 (+),score=39.59 TRINITY_DN25163_c0_g1_i1:324-647(+)